MLPVLPTFSNTRHYREIACMVAILAYMHNQYQVVKIHITVPWNYSWQPDVPEKNGIRFQLPGKPNWATAFNHYYFALWINVNYIWCHPNSFSWCFPPQASWIPWSNLHMIFLKLNIYVIFYHFNISFWLHCGKIEDDQSIHQISSLNTILPHLRDNACYVFIYCPLHGVSKNLLQIHISFVKTEVWFSLILVMVHLL